MKLNFFIALLLCCGLFNKSTAQCPPLGTLILSTQADIDNFSTNYPNCTVIPAGVNIFVQDDNNGVDNITNLSGLSALTSVGGNLFIENNIMLMNVNGLLAITSIGGNFGVQDNSALSLCCNLCPLLAADAADPTVIGGIIVIDNNAVGCNSEAEINACSPCAIAAVPTLGQWGLILLALLLLNLGLISILQSRYRLAGVPGTYFQNLPLVTSMVLADRKAFLQQYLIAGLFITILFAISIFFFSYELMPFDLPGSILAAGLLAFFVRVMEQRREV